MGRRDLHELAELDISLNQVTAELETEDVEAFARSYEELLAALGAVAARSDAIGRDLG